MDKLKSCPFCGGEPCIQEHVFYGYKSTYGIVCLDCCCETRQFYDTEEEAIEAWNRRAGKSSIDIHNKLIGSDSFRE